MKPDDTKRKFIVGAGVLAVTGVIIAGAVIAKNQSETQTTTDTSSTTSATDTTGEESAKQKSATDINTYKDGTYSATGTYSSPGGNEKIKIDVTVVSNVITATSAQEQATSRDGEQYQELFIANYKSLVVGKSINSVELGQVSGSSLTSNGFNDALEQIKEQAKV